MTANPLQSPQAGGGLLPCPFCGGAAERIDIEDGDNAGGSFVHCTVCDASGNVEFGFKENFISNWNRRASTPAPSAGEAVAKMVERVTNRAESLERIGATEDAADLRALLSALADAVPPSIPAGGVLVEALIERAKEIGLLSIEDVREVAATLSLPAGGVAVSDATELAAKRWNALLRCARIRMQGSAGFDPKTGERQEYSNATKKTEKSDKGWVHFGAEFWSIYPGHEDDDLANRWGSIALTALADDVLLKEQRALEAALSPEAKTGGL